MDFRKRALCFVARPTAAHYFWEARQLLAAITAGDGVLDQCCGTMMRPKQLRLQEVRSLSI
jgi:hypothetical protein